MDGVTPMDDATPMDDIMRFLRANVCGDAPAVFSRRLHPGVAGWELLERIDPSLLDSTAAARLMYARNLALLQPDPFAVPACLGAAERALMYCSYGAHRDALAALGIPLSCEIIGAEAVGRSGAVSRVLAVRLSGTSSAEQREFGCDGLTYRDYGAEPLCHAELLHLYIKARELQAGDGERALAGARVLALANRALYGANELRPALRAAFELMRAEATGEARGLEAVLEDAPELAADAFCSPIVFRHELRVQLARAYMACHDYGAAYEVLRDYPLFDERIDCLVAMRSPAAAAREIHEYIGLLGNVDDRSDQILLSGLYMKLGHIHQDAAYFDTAAAVFRSARPHQLKGLLLFGRKQYAEAAAAFEEALRLTPGSEELRFSYACALVELGRVAEALRIFRLLKSENPQSESISKNLSYCYYRLEDIEGTLDTLRSVALHDHSAMKQFLYISVQNDRLDNVRWSLRRVCYDASLAEVVNYLVQMRKMEAAELHALLQENMHLDGEQRAAVLAAAGTR